jgi:hypothetical protein
MTEINNSTKFFELLDIRDFSLKNAENNAEKFRILSERLLAEENEEWFRAWELYNLFYSASKYYVEHVCKDL